VVAFIVLLVIHVLLCKGVVWRWQMYEARRRKLQQQLLRRLWLAKRESLQIIWGLKPALWRQPFWLAAFALGVPELQESLQIIESLCERWSEMAFALQRSSWCVWCILTLVALVLWMCE
jgi:hypothetical protein